MHLELLREIPEAPELRSRWNALVHKMDKPEVFYTYEWALAMQRAYRTCLVPLLALAYEGGTLIGVTALATDPASQEAGFLSATTADYCDFVSETRDRSALIEGVVSELQELKFRRIRLANLPADSVSSAILKGMQGRHGVHVFSRPAYKCASVSMGSLGEREVQKARLFGKKIRRYMATLERQGHVTIEHLRHFEQIEDALPQFSKAHVARFLATGRISNLARPGRRLFLRGLAHLLSDSGSLTLTRLMVGNRPVAWNYGFQFAGSWFWYQPTFDSEFEQCSPGICLLSKIIAEACETPHITRVDMGLGTEGYKDRFANGVRETLHVTLTASRSRHVKEVLHYRAADLAKAKPQIEKTTRWALSKLKAFKQPGTAIAKTLASRRKLRALAETQKRALRDGQGQVHSNGDSSEAVSLRALVLDDLAGAVMHYFDDEETLNYLLRCAKRLRSSHFRGYALIRPDRVPVAFAWVSSLQKLATHPESLRQDGVPKEDLILFEPWEPISLRGRNLAKRLAQCIAEELAKQNCFLWILSPESDSKSLSGIQEFRFRRRYSIFSRERLFYQRVEIPNSPTAIASAEVPVAS